MNLHETLRDAFTVKYIMTPRQHLEVGSVKPVLRGEPCYDVIPRTEDDCFVGLWVLREGEYLPEPITEEWIVAHSTPIPEIIRIFSGPHAKPAYLVVNGARVDGIVSPADLNKVACRTYLFTLVGELEYCLAQLLREYFQSSEERMLEFLSPDRQTEVRKLRMERQANDMDTGYIEVLSLSDIVNIICKNEDLRFQLGFSSRKQSENCLNGLVHFRNVIAHPVREMSSAYKVRDILEKVELIERVLEQLARTPAAGQEESVQMAS
ncbi:MAG: hypothetical protein WHS44_11050 [Fimbriimonadales bacterium]|nr:MAG: hypothetical protein KatS3mg018_0269 [Fimbriimonadales bacterium]